MRRLQMRIVVALFAAALGAAPAFADVTLPAMFSDNMVLQQGLAVPVWGWASAGEKVTVRLGKQEVAATAGADGKWSVALAPLTAAADQAPLELTVAGTNTLTIKNVLVGEVWYCSGQSNMQLAMTAVKDANDEIAAANYPQIRLFTVAEQILVEPNEHVEGSWVTCSPETVKGFSAAAYFFGRDLHKALNVPVGLIHASMGGSQAEAWMSRPTLESIPEANSILVDYDKMMADWPKRKVSWEKSLADWQDTVAKAKEAGTAPPKRPAPPHGLYPGHTLTVCGLYNGEVVPVAPYAVRGAIWYQGESNRDRAYQYRKLLPALIADWRKAWKLPQMAFVLVQLPGFGAIPAEPAENVISELREAQLLTAQTVPDTAMAIAIDLGDPNNPNNIHPPDKQDVGSRLAVAALGTAYGKKIEFSGPIFDGMSIEGAKARIKFKHIGSGLAVHGEKCDGFAIAGADRKFVWAQAKIDGDTVVAWNDQVPAPVAVRYAWGETPPCSLYNKEGLPASPFRTDDWHIRPVYDKIEVRSFENRKIQARISFKLLSEGGLVDHPLAGLQAAGADGKFGPAQAKVFAKTSILVWTDSNDAPMAVKYEPPTDGNMALVTGFGMAVEGFTAIADPNQAKR